MAEKAHDVIVIREGESKTVPHVDVVPGDIIIFQ
jgi:magnesium-transporting ATPase (P-type)